MPKKQLPFSDHQLRDIVEQYGSPLHIYNEQGIRTSARELKAAFDWAKGYKNYFAVKATPTPGILEVLQEEGMGFDCSSRAELVMMQRLGVNGQDIFYTSNNTPKQDFELAIELGAIVNIDDLTQVPVFLEALGEREYQSVAVRYNPGDQHGGNAIIGEPIEAKYGMSLAQIGEAFTLLAKANIKRFGIHTMVASNELDPKFFQKTAELIKGAIGASGVEIDFVNLGGGFGVAYNPDQEQLDFEQVASGIRRELVDSGVDIYTENGRAITAPHGYLLTRVQYVMQKHKSYIGVDASMHNLMRPGM
ncbi:MAG: diaminopimelate decarboxylase family protein, partial [Cumulibacter sp.]